MAINPLYGYDTSQYGYAAANGLDPTKRAARYTGAQMPAWMTDLNARGIGESDAFTAKVPDFIDIPRGDGTGGFNMAPTVQAPTMAATPPEFGPNYTVEGAGGQPDMGGNVGVSLGGWSDLMNALGFGGDSGAGGGSTGASNEAASAAGGSMDSAGAGFGGGAGTGPGGWGGLYHGGIVTPNKLRGPNPPGPDDGMAALDIGEGVLTAKAIQHYGPEIVARLNRLQVPKGAFGSARK